MSDKTIPDLLRELDQRMTPGPWASECSMGEKDGLFAIVAVDNESAPPESDSWATIAVLESFCESPGTDSESLTTLRNAVPLLADAFETANVYMDRAVKVFEEGWEPSPGWVSRAKERYLAARAALLAALKGEE